MVGRVNDRPVPSVCADMKRWRMVLSAAVLIVSACTTDGEPERETAPATYRTIECPADISRIVLAEIECGTLTAPAQRESSKGEVTLFVTTFRPEGEAAADPVLWFGGDLGVAPDYNLIASSVEGLGREVIMLDARGSGRSEPSLACPEVEALPHTPLSEPVDSDRTETELLDAIAACRGRLVAQGVDPSAFDLEEMAADAEDLRIALGIESWNVMSHGTTGRIALEYLRRHPEHVRAAVLDSPGWPGLDPFAASIKATRHATAELVAACADDAVCRRFTTDLGRDIEELAARLGERPNVVDADGTEVSFDDGWFRVWLRARLSFFRPPQTFAPLEIVSLLKGHEASVLLEAERLIPRQLCQGFFPNCWTDLVRSFGMIQTVMCRDVIAFTEPGDLDAMVDGEAGYDEAFAGSPYLRSCEAWDVGRGDPEVASPVRSDVPVLVIVGRFDPYATPSDVEAAMTGLSNGTLIVSPENGHQVTGTDTQPDTCIVDIRNEWLNAPNTPVDTACVDGLRLGFEDSVREVIEEGVT